MFVLLIKASLVLVILLAFYKLILEKESFFSANRLYLLGCLGLAFILPYIILPTIVKHQGYFDTLLASSTILKEDTQSSQIATGNNILKALSENEKEQNSEDIPIELNNDKRSTNTNEQLKAQPQQIYSKSSSRGILFWMYWVYIFGVIVLSINLLAQVVSILRKVAKNKDQIEDEGTIIVNINEETEPCSFFKYIFINPSSYNFETYEQIIAHEKIHVAKRHTLDLLISEIAVIILWFNPFVWLFRKEVEKNIEYQTDQLIVSSENDVKQEYQLNLVKIACNTSPLAITTNYNQSLIKQRILKMNSKRSNNFNYWKYTFGMPLLFILLLVLNKPLDSLASTLELPEHLSLVSTDIGSENMEKENLANSSEEENEPKNEVSSEEGSKIVTPSNSEKIEAKNENVLRSISSMSEMIADCAEFEKAVASGDLERVKEILKTLDPDCLKVKNNKKSNLNSVKDMVRKSKKSNTDTNQAKTGSKRLSDEESEVCIKLKEAVKRYDLNKTRWILLEEDLSCLNDGYGDPIRDEKLIKGLLGYGAHLDIDHDKVIHINDIGFTISIPDSDDDECKDPSFMKLVEAIKDGDHPKVIRLLSNADFTCPLNQGGVKNDFPFIKELMKYKPEVLLVNKEAVTIYGVGVDIDLDLQMTKPKNSRIQHKEEPKPNYQQAQLINDIEDLLSNTSIASDEEVSCLTLMDAIIVDDYSLSKDIVSEVNPNCFHRHTHTQTINGDNVKVTDETVTPLIIATMRSNHKIMKILIENKADVNYTGDGNITPLMMAVMKGNLESVKIIVNNKAKLNTPYTDNMTALDIAVRDKKRSIIKYLKSKGAKSNTY